MKKSKISLWSIIVFIKKQPLVIICLILSIILAFIPYITANILNYVFVLINKRIYNILILFIFLYVFTRYIDSSMGVLKNYLFDKNRTQITKNITKKVIDSTINIDPLLFENEKWLKDFNRMDKISGCLADTYQASLALMTQFIILSTYLVYLFQHLSAYAFLGILIIIPSLIESVSFTKIKYYLERNLEKENQRSNAIKLMFFNIDFLKEIKVFQSLNQIVKIWQEKHEKIFRRKFKLELKFLVLNTLLLFFSSGIVFLILSIFYIKAYGDPEKTIRIITLIPFMLNLITAAKTTSNNINGVVYSWREWKEINNFIKENQKNQRRGKGLVAFPIKIKAEHLFFKYPNKDEPVLKDISLEIEPNKIYAFVGENGSGKSTLLKLLSGIYLPEQGKVKYGDVSTEDLDHKVLKNNISFIFQEPIKYPFSLKKNIVFDSEKYNLQAMIKALNLSIDINTLDNKIMYPGFDNSINISGGQWQKISIARAMINDKANIYIFDEPTSALDPKSEIEIFNTFKEIAKHKTILIATHRLGLTKAVDCIIVMEQGRISAIGKHDNLLKTCDAYNRLYEAQASWYNF